MDQKLARLSVMLFAKYLLYLSVPIKCGSRNHAGGPGSSGIIWMREYENFMECEYEIAAGDPFASISVYIHEIDIEYSKGCTFDTLMVS